MRYLKIFYITELVDSHIKDYILFKKLVYYTLLENNHTLLPIGATDAFTRNYRMKHILMPVIIIN